MSDIVITEWFVYCVDSTETLQWESDCRDMLPSFLVDIILKQWKRVAKDDHRSDHDLPTYSWPEWKDNDLLDAVLDFFSHWASAKAVARVHGWNGFTLYTPEIFYLWQTNQRQPMYGFVIEQDPETTFIVSPQEIPDLRPLRVVAVGNGTNQ